jgi:hypothetical protein
MTKNAQPAFDSKWSIFKVQLVWGRLLRYDEKKD